MRERVGWSGRAWRPAAWTLLLVLGVGVGVGSRATSRAEEPDGAPGGPRTAAELFEPTRVWTVHLQFTPEQWQAMEPRGGTNNPFDPSGFGMGMFLTPPLMRDADTDQNSTLSAAEFGALADAWFQRWDTDADGTLDAAQVRAGLKQALLPPGGQPGEGGEGPQPGFSLQARKGKRNGLSGMMGIDFEYVHADLEFNGHRLADVGVRYKGNGTFLESRGSLKRSIKLDLNRYVKGQKLAGLTTLNLHNNVTDAGLMNEVIAYNLYRAFGVPAPRTAYARVYVTVPGKHDRKYFGLYSLVENIDRSFLRARDLDADTAIFKPSSPELFTDLGDDWSAYEQTYDPKTDLTGAQERRLIDFCKLVSHAPDAEFAARLAEFVDLDEAARFLAVSVWIGDLDGLLTTGQNFYLLLEPSSNRFLFVPWDKDHTFGSWIAGEPADREQHSILEPWEGRKLLLERVFQVEAFRARYLAALTEFSTAHARPEQIEARVQSLAQAIRPAVQEEGAQKLSRFDAVAAGKLLPGALFGFGKPSSTILPFVKARARSVQAQLAGQTDDAFVMGKGRPGKPADRPEFKPEEMIEPALFKALDQDKSGTLSRGEFTAGFAAWFALWDTDKDGLVTEDQARKGLNRALPFSPFGPPRKPGGKEPATPAASAPGPESTAAQAPGPG